MMCSGEGRYREEAGSYYLPYTSNPSLHIISYCLQELATASLNTHDILFDTFNLERKSLKVESVAMFCTFIVFLDFPGAISSKLASIISPLTHQATRLLGDAKNKSKIYKKNIIDFIQLNNIRIAYLLKWL